MLTKLLKSNRDNNNPGKKQFLNCEHKFNAQETHNCPKIKCEICIKNIQHEKFEAHKQSNEHIKI